MNSISKATLSVKYNKLKESLNSDENKYYHLKSLHNFIRHIDSIRNQDDRMKYASSIDHYIDAVSGKKISDVETSLRYFNEFLAPIGKYYETHLHFSVVVKPWILIVWIFIAFTFILVLGINKYIRLGISVLLILYVVMLFRKLYSGKLYGFQW